MSAIFGPQQTGPTRLNSVQINQSTLGYPIIVLMGTGKVQQSILWTDGFAVANAPAVGGGKGYGGKGANGYLYSADVIAALCAGGPGGVLGVGDVWSGQSWLQNTSGTEAYTIAGSTPSYTPTYAKTTTADKGATSSVSVSASYSDVAAPAPTVLSGTINAPMSRQPYNSVSPNSLTSGQYSVSPTNTYYFSPADDGVAVQVSYSFALGTISKQINEIIPSGLNVAINGNLPFAADGGVIYYSPGSSNPLNGTALTLVSGTPTVTGTYSYNPGNYHVTGSSGSYTITVITAASYTFAPGDENAEVQITYKLDNSYFLPAGTQTSVNFLLIPGQPFQSPWALLQSNYEGAALGYTGLALAVYAPMDLGSGAQIQQNAFEIITADAWGGGIPDCNPVQCIMQVATNPMWGLGGGPIPFPLSAIDNGYLGTWGGGNSGNSGNGSLAMAARVALVGHTPGPFRPAGGPLPLLAMTDETATAYFAANGFFISPMIDRQDTAASLIGRWLEAGQCAAFMSESLWKLVPYGDTSATGNGATWTAPDAYAAQLDDTCFLVKDKKNLDPVKPSSSPWQDAYNTVQVSFNNRQNQYAPEIIPASDKGAINRYGSRIEDPQSYDFITTLTAARFAATMRVQRAVYTRNTFEFSLPFRFRHLEPMDIITITTGSLWNPNGNTLQIVNRPVRITKIVDNPDHTRDVTCEDYIWGVQTPLSFNKAVSQAVAPPNQFEDPGDTQAVVFEATDRLTSFAGNQIWIGASGASARWGGCNVFASMDGDTYDPIGTIETPSRLGTLEASFASGSDPDTTDSLVVNLVPGSAQLESGTDADADQNNTLCYVDGELIAYSACAISGVDQYTMSTYIRRGQMGSTIAAHAAASNFLRLDNTVMKYTYDPSWAGKTVYLKFQSFNSYGNSPQDLSTLTAVTFAVPGVNPGAFDKATGAVGNVGGVMAPTIVAALVNSGAVPPGSYGGTSYGAISLYPTTASGAFAVTFTATLTGCSGPVTWSVADGGIGSTVDSSGNWAPPSTPPPHGSAIITCSLNSYPGTYGTATVTW